MSEEPDEKKKVSIADALDQLRQGGPPKDQESAATKAARQAATQKAQRIPPAFWLQNLQDSIQRRRDTLFDKLAAEGGATDKAEMQRRDLISVESFFLPPEMVSEVTPAKPAQQVGDVTRFQDIEILDLNNAPGTQVEDSHVGEVAPAKFQSVGRFDGVETLDFKAIVGMGGMEEVGQGQGGPEIPGTRFDGALDLDNPLMGLELEEVETEVVDTAPKKFKVNPMIRQMFQNMGNNEK